MATWFRRPGGHIFDISLHGFPIGMIKSCRRYWTREIADSIVQLKNIRFDNPMFSLSTTFDRDDFTRLLTERFAVPAERVDGVFRHRPRDEFLRRSIADRRRAVRAILSRPRGRDSPVDGADHLRQRLDARRPGDHLRHRVLELHVEGRLHVRGRDRSADRADARGADQEAASMSVSAATSRKSTSATGGSRASRSTAAGSTPGRSSRTRISRRRSSIWSAASISTATFSTRPRRCGSIIQAARSTWRSSRAKRSTKAAATCCSARPRRCFAPSCS